MQLLPLESCIRGAFAPLFFASTAAHVFRALTKSNAADLLSQMDLTSDFPVLRFFGDICAGVAHGLGRGLSLSLPSSCRGSC